MLFNVTCPLLQENLEGCLKNRSFGLANIICMLLAMHAISNTLR